MTKTQHAARLAGAALSGVAGLALLALLLAGAAGAAPAVNLCTDHDSLVKGMASPPVWHRVVVALKADGLMLEIFAGPAGGWVAVWTWPGGQSCVVDAGASLSILPPPKGDEM